MMVLRTWRGLRKQKMADKDASSSCRMPVTPAACTDAAASMADAAVVTASASADS